MTLNEKVDNFFFLRHAVLVIQYLGQININPVKFEYL